MWRSFRNDDYAGYPSGESSDEESEKEFHSVFRRRLWILWALLVLVSHIGLGVFKADLSLV
jgi:hypothetical protein